MQWSGTKPTPSERAAIASKRRIEISRTRIAGNGQGHPTTAERIYTDEEREFLRAMDAFIAQTGRRFPTWSEVLSVAKGMGYARIAQDVKKALPV